MSIRTIAKEQHLNKDTVSNYIRRAKIFDGLLTLEEHELNNRLKVGGNTAYTDPRFEDFKIRLPYNMTEKEKPHVTLNLLREEYKREHPSGAIA